MKNNGTFKIKLLVCSSLMGMMGSSVLASAGVSRSTLADSRFQTEVMPIENALEKVLQLNGVSYHWKDLVRDQKRGERLGLIAQEVEKIFPQVVITTISKTSLPGGTKRISYGDLVSPLIEAIKELNAKWSALSAQFTASQSALDSVQARAVILEQEKGALQATVSTLQSSVSTLQATNSDIKFYLCARDPRASFCQ